MAMKTIREAELQSIKENRFALLPPKIMKQEDQQEGKQEAGSAKFDVQCQICGRMGLMSIAEMQNHYSRHEADMKKEEGAEDPK